MKNNSMETRTWKCPDCGFETEWSYSDIVEKGEPICPNGDDMVLMDEEKAVEESIDANVDIDNAEIARLIAEGNTSGILDNEAGYRIVWDLKVEKFKN